MRRMLTLILAVVFILGMTTAAAALDYVGARATGMAGAFVAVADDGTAAYWNPAGITQIKVVGITPSLSVDGDFTIPSTSIGDTYPPDLGNLDLQLNGMVGVTFKGMAVSAIFDATATTASNSSESAGTVEVAGTGMFTLAHEFADVFAVGVNLKAIYGKGLFVNAPADPTGASYSESIGTGYAVDLGAMFKAGKLVRIGAVLENAVGTISWDNTYYSYNVGLQEWTVDSTGSNEETLEQILHLGLAVKPPVIGTLIAFQADKPLESGTMTYRIGFEQSVLLVKLRAGAVLDEEFAPFQYTAGIGFKLGPVVLDVGAVSDQDLALQAAILTAGFTF